MKLNSLKPAEGAKHSAKRVGRGMSSGLGKTGGRGHKGQKSRSGGFTKIGFEGGQMPIQRRLPKVGFRSRKGRFAAEVRLNEVAAMEGDTITLDTLKQQGVVPSQTRQAKVILSGEIDRAVTLGGEGLKATKGAREAIEKAGGKVG